MKREYKVESFEHNKDYQVHDDIEHEMLMPNSIIARWETIIIPTGEILKFDMPNMGYARFIRRNGERLSIKGKVAFKKIGQIK